MNGIDEQFFGKIASLMLDLQSIEEYISSHYRETVEWSTRDGKLIKICKIDDKHLDNIINMLKSQPEQTKVIKTWLSLLCKEKVYRNDYFKIKQELIEYQEIANKIF